MNILVSGIGGPTPRSIAKAIRVSYPKAKIIGVDANKKAIGFFIKGLCDEYKIVPKASDPSYWDVIEDLKKEFDLDIAFIQPEKEVLEWGKYFENHGKYPIDTFIPPVSYTSALMDKANMADMLKDTHFIPKTLRITHSNPKFNLVEDQIGFPCWIRASVGSGGYGSMKITSLNDLKAWLFICSEIVEFTVSEFLPGRHLANQMMYVDGMLIKSAGLHCVEYVMADIAPSKVTGNTSFGRLINEDKLLDFCENCMAFISDKLKEKPHGIFSFDLKEDFKGELKVTEINIRHMAYTGILSSAGFDLSGDSIKLLTGNFAEVKSGRHVFDKNYVFIRDVDSYPILLTEEEINVNSSYFDN